MMMKRQQKAAVLATGVAAFFAFGACAGNELRASASSDRLLLTSETSSEEFTKSDGSGGEASRDASVHEGMPSDEVGSDSERSEATQQAGQAAPPDAGSSEVKPSDSASDGTMSEKKVDKRASKKQKKRQVRTEKTVESTETAPAEPQDPHAGHGH